MTLSFTYPWLLALLIVPVLLLGWVWRRTSGSVVLPFDHGLPVRQRWGLILNLTESIPALLLGLAIILLAGPQRTGEPRTKRVLTNIQLCVDVSYSMTSPFGTGDRYDAAMKSIEEFVSYRKGDAFGLTFFGNAVLHWVPLTTDVSAIRCAPPFMRPERIPYWFNGTEIGRALRACKDLLVHRPEGDRMILLLTDGMSGDIMNGQDAELARELKDNNIVVFAIVILGDVQMSSEVATIARMTGGEAFEAGDPGALQTVFKRIDEMKRARLEKTVGETADDYYPWCLAGLILGGVYLLGSLGMRYTPW